MPITFQTTKTTIPGWVTTLHQNQQRAYAYQSGGFNVAIFGSLEPFYVLSPGLTVSEKTAQNLNDWAIAVFGANSIMQMKHSEGEAVAGVWRPGLYFDAQIDQALSVTESQRLQSEQSLHLLVDRLYDLFLYVEPSSAAGLASYGHKSRELLILACTEVENSWRSHAQDASMLPSNGRMMTTQDYIKLRQSLYLAEYELSLVPYPNVAKITPFLNWSSAAPTQSISWYDAYNKTKHDREGHFSDASLQNAIDAVAASIVMHIVRYGPFRLLNGSVASAQINQMFRVKLATPDFRSFYVPNVDPSQRAPNLVCGDGLVKNWHTLPLVV